jgi:hypothetical protein
MQEVLPRLAAQVAAWPPGVSLSRIARFRIARFRRPRTRMQDERMGTAERGRNDHAMSCSKDSQFSGTLSLGPGTGWSSGCERGATSRKPRKTLRFS